MAALLGILWMGPLGNLFGGLAGIMITSHSLTYSGRHAHHRQPGRHAGQTAWRFVTEAARHADR